MGLIVKLGLIGIVAVAVVLAVVWDIYNQSKTAARQKANAAETSVAQTTEPIEPIPTLPDPVPPIANSEPVIASQPIQVQPVQTQPKPVAPASPQKYVIKKGDTLTSIAKRHYGDGLKWRTIYEANYQSISDPNILPVGTEILIPASATAQNMAILEHPARTTYIVQKGDTLSKIADRHYGDPGRWKDIYQANRQTIQDKNVVIPGTVLVIPDVSSER